MTQAPQQAAPTLLSGDVSFQNNPHQTRWIIAEKKSTHTHDKLFYCHVPGMI